MKKILLSIIILIILAGLVAGGFFVKNKYFGQNKDVIKTEKTNVPIEPTPQYILDDNDRDGILDNKEKELGLSNRDFDTDGDGLNDKDEIDRWKTDPKKNDTDGDGFWDGFEVINGYNPNGEGKL